PLTTQVDKKNLDDNPYWRNCSDEELTFQISGQSPRKEIQLDRLNNRRTLLSQFDGARRAMDGDAGVTAYDRFQQRALALVASERTRKALDLQSEPAEVRDTYGRHLLRQS